LQAEDGIRDLYVTGVQTCALPISVGSTEAELVRRARERDEPAIRAIMQSNNRRLYRLARGILRNDSEAEDVVQETYVRAFTHLRSEERRVGKEGRGGWPQ